MGIERVYWNTLAILPVCSSSVTSRRNRFYLRHVLKPGDHPYVWIYRTRAQQGAELPLANLKLKSRRTSLPQISAYS